MGTDLVKLAQRLPTPLDGGNLGWVNPDTGEALPASESSDRTLLHGLRQIRELEERLREMKLVAGAVLRDRHGVGKAHSAGFGFKVNESVSWAQGNTREALDELLAGGVITEADVRRAMPAKPKPDATQLKALIGRLTTSNPEAAKRLADAATKSPPSVGEIEPETVEGSVVE